MANFSSYQRAMMGDAARTAHSAANTELHLRDLACSSAVNTELQYAQTVLQADIARATRENNRMLAEQLRMQKQQLEEQQNEYERRHREELKRDQQAFAMWRQTEDGKAFVEWFARSKEQTDAIIATEQRWRVEVDAVKADWLDARRAEVDEAFDDPRQRNAERSNMLFIGAGACFVAWIVSMGMDVVGLVNAVLIMGMLVFCVYGVAARIDQGLAAREASQAELRELGTAELGFDPFDGAGPSWAQGDAVGYAHDIISYRSAAYTQHPPASALPPLQTVQFVDPQTIRCERLRQLLPGL